MTGIAYGREARGGTQPPPVINTAPKKLPWEDAVIVTGLPRSGTTSMHRLLAELGELRAFRFWELWTSPGEVRSGANSLRRLLAQDRLNHLDNKHPDFQSVHPIESVDEPDDADVLLEGGTDLQVLRDALATRAAADQPPRRPWLIQSLTAYDKLDQVAELFPGARIVEMQRPFQDVLASAERLRRAMGVDVAGLEEELRESRRRALRQHYAGQRLVVALERFAENPKGTAIGVLHMLKIPIRRRE